MSSITSRIISAYEREEQYLHHLKAQATQAAQAAQAAKAAQATQATQATQVGGSHYLKAIQPWDIIRAWGLGFHRGNIIKYVLRAPGKNGKEDLEKAKHYLEYLIANYDDLKKENIL